MNKKHFFLIAAAIVIIGGYLLAGYVVVDRKDQFYPAELMDNLRETGIALELYFRQKGHFPGGLGGLQDLGFDLDHAKDPYSADGNLLYYSRVVTVTGERYELSTLRISSPVSIGWATWSSDNVHWWTMPRLRETLWEDLR